MKRVQFATTKNQFPQCSDSEHNSLQQFNVYIHDNSYQLQYKHNSCVLAEGTDSLTAQAKQLDIPFLHAGLRPINVVLKFACVYLHENYGCKISWVRAVLSSSQPLKLADHHFLIDLINVFCLKQPSVTTEQCLYKLYYDNTGTALILVSIYLLTNNV